MYSISSSWSCLIRRPPDQSLLPANRRLSQVATSFIVSECQGIPHKPLISWIKQKLVIFCGDKRTRTADICRAKATLYQLSYTPSWAILDLNQRPHPYQGCALTNWANSPLNFSFTAKVSIIFNLNRPKIFPLKEVIQPHLPVGLPCYDFTPVTNSTLGALLQNG